MPLNTADHWFILSIIWPDLDLCSALIRSCTALVNPSIINDNKSSNSPNHVCPSICLFALPSLYINKATPITIKNIKAYFLTGYTCKEKECFS